MKLFKLITNNGNWGGYQRFYEIAENEEEAITKCKYYQNAIDRGEDHCIKELTGEELLRSLLISDWEQYDVKFEIMRKSEVGGI